MNLAGADLRGAAPGFTTGNPLNDTATLGRGNNQTGTIVFNLFGPGDSTCSAAPFFTDTQTVSGDGSYSSHFSPTMVDAGTYQLLPPNLGYVGHANAQIPAVPIIGGSFAVFAVSFWAYFRHRPARDDGEEEAEQAAPP